MNRLVNFALLAIMIVGAIVTYDMKHRAEKASERVARLHSAIEQERQTIQILRAELSTLMQPGRLQALVDHYPDYFRLEPFTSSQLAAIEDIPLRPIGQASEEAIAEIIRQNLNTIQ